MSTTKNRFLFLVLGLVIALSAFARAQKDDDDDDDKMVPMHPPVMKPTEKPAGAEFVCPYEKDFQEPHKFGAYTLRLLPTAKKDDDDDDKDKKKDKDKKDKKDRKDKDDKDKKDKDDKDGDEGTYHDDDARCRAVLTTRFGHHIPIAYEWALSIDPISGTDLNGDGKPEIVLSGYSGGLHCCYVYEIVSLDRTPKVIHIFSSPVPIKFEKQPDGTVLIRAYDGVFNYFLIPPQTAVIPQLIFKLDGNNLVDVSAQHPEIYDKEIAEARAQLTADELEKFKKSNFHTALYMDQVPAIHKILTIVLDYVYSGREDQAWQALQQYWPESDLSRVRSLIMERRRRGMLSNLACDCHPALIAQPPKHPKRKPEPPDEVSDPRVKSIIDD
jgi:hypothetical protein